MATLTPVSPAPTTLTAYGGGYGNYVIGYGGSFGRDLITPAVSSSGSLALSTPTPGTLTPA